MKEISCPESLIQKFFLKGNEEYFTIFFILALCYIAQLITIYWLRYRKNKNGFLEFVKSVLIWPTMIGGILIYWIGYHLSEPESNFLSKICLSLFSNARLFILGNDLIEVHEKVNHAYLLWFSIFSVSAALISTSIIVNLFGRRFKDLLKMYFIRPDENFVFFGINEPGLLLAKDILRVKPKAFIVFVQNMLKEEKTEWLKELNELNVFIISKDSLLDSFNLQHEEMIFQPGETEKTTMKHERLRKLSLKKISLYRKLKNCPSFLFLLSDKEEENFHLMHLLINEIKENNIHQPIDIHLRSMTRNAEALYTDNEISKDDAENKNIKVHIHNQSAVAVAQLVKEKSPVNWMIEQYKHHVHTETATVSRDFTIMLIGFGLTGEAALRKFYEQGQFVGSQFRAIVVDQDMDAKKGSFAQHFPGMIEDLKENLQFHEMKARTTSFFELLLMHKDALDYIVVALGDDELNMQVAYDIHHFLKKVQATYRIFVQVVNNDYYSKFHFKDDTPILTFGMYNKLFTESNILKGLLGQTAKKIHDSYNENAPKEKIVTWEALDGFTRASNISVVEHKQTKLLLCDLTDDKVKKLESYEKLEEYLGTERKTNLGRLEHLRWNAFHFSNGWSTWNLKDIPPTQTKSKDPDKKLHACLVSWDDLDAVSKRFNNEPFKSYDLKCMKVIFENVQAGFYDTSKQLPSLKNPPFSNDLKKIFDDLAKEVHNEWMQGRQKEGWKYGLHISGELKQHPSMVPYEELEKSEKEIDRNTVKATLRYLLANGFEIRKIKPLNSFARFLTMMSLQSKKVGRNNK